MFREQFTSKLCPDGLAAVGFYTSPGRCLSFPGGPDVNGLIDNCALLARTGCGTSGGHMADLLP